MNHELVSIAMPVFNCENTIVSAVRSVLNQTVNNWEVIVIDDGSSDQTVDKLRMFRDTRIHIYQDGIRRGLSYRLNQAVELAAGEYIARMDGDDIAYPNRLEVQLDFMKMHPEVDLVGGGVFVFGAEGQPIGKRTPPHMHEQICRRPISGFPIAHPTYVGKTSWFKKFGYRESAIRCEDQDLLLRAFRSSRFANVSRIVLGYREDRIQLKKILQSRRFLAKSIYEFYRSEGHTFKGAFGVLEQCAKGLVDTTAVATGLNHYLLRHRAGAVSASEIAEWSVVWRESSIGDSM